MSLYSVAVLSWEVPMDIETQEDAIDVAIEYILNSHRVLWALEAPSEWVDQALVYEDIVGYYAVRYTSGEWTVEVGNAVVLEPVYDIAVVFTGDTGFIWKGTVDQSGNVVETEFSMDQ
jgi:hypothetical protein